jgi:plastocyanin
MSGMHGGRDTSRGSQVQGGMAAAVTISDFSFEPGNLRVPVGATVTWTNEDSAPHDATARGADWKTDRLSDADSDTLTFDEPGDYDYYCSIHPNMKARLVVR